MLCVHLILLLSIVRPSVRPAVFNARSSRRDGKRSAPGYPPYNIKRSGENAYNISVAVAGFASEDLSIEVKENVNDPRQQAERR